MWRVSWWSLPPAASDSWCALPAVEEDRAAGPAGTAEEACAAPLPCALASARRPGARGAASQPSSDTCPLAVAAKPAEGQTRGLWCRCAWMGADRCHGEVTLTPSAPFRHRGLRLPGWTGLGVWSVLQEVGTRSGDLRRPETAGGPWGSERGGVASPVLRVNEKHPTPQVPGCPPRRPHHGDTVSACSACTASRCLRGDTGTLGFRRVPLTKHMMGGGSRPDGH